MFKRICLMVMASATGYLASRLASEAFKTENNNV